LCAWSFLDELRNRVVDGPLERLQLNVIASDGVDRQGAAIESDGREARTSVGGDILLLDQLAIEAGVRPVAQHDRQRIDGLRFVALGGLVARRRIVALKGEA